MILVRTSLEGGNCVSLRKNCSFSRSRRARRRHPIKRGEKRKFHRWPRLEKERANSQPVRLASLKIWEILSDSRLTIPEYQRIYCWATTDITRFWASIRDLKELHLGSIILYENGEKKEIVDGQQRLLTLSLMLHILSLKKAPLAPGPALPLLELETDNSEEIRNIANAKWVIEEILFSGLNDGEIENIRKKIRNIQVTQVTVANDYPDLAYVFFNNQNSKGEKLTDFDLLKAHHLRFIADDETAAQKVAREWARMQGKMSAFRDKKPAFHHALGFLVYRLRKLARRQEYNEAGHYIRDEFQSTALPDGLPPGFLPRLDALPMFIRYHSPIAGGMDFFVFAQKFFEAYKSFEATPAAKKLAAFSSRHRYLYDMAECLLFAYYLKFGTRCLAEALFCICAVLGHYRYALPKVTKNNIGLTRESDLIYLIDQSPSTGFFLVQALEQVETPPAAASLISPSQTQRGKRAGWQEGDPIYTLQDAREARKQNINTVKTDYYATLCRACEELRDEFSIDAIKTAIKKLYPLK